MDAKGLTTQLAGVANEIQSVEKAIREVEAGIKQAAAAGDQKEKDYLRKKEEQLRKKEEQLRKKEEQLREEKTILLRQQVAQPGVRRLYEPSAVAPAQAAQPYPPPPQQDEEASLRKRLLAIQIQQEEDAIMKRQAEEARKQAEEARKQAEHKFRLRALKNKAGGSGFSSSDQEVRGYSGQPSPLAQTNIRLEKKRENKYRAKLNRILNTKFERADHRQEHNFRRAYFAAKKATTFASFAAADLHTLNDDDSSSPPSGNRRAI